MPDKQAVAFIAVESHGQRTGNLVRALDPGLFLEACRREGNGAQWAYEKALEPPGAAGPQPVSQEGFPDNQLTLKPYRQARLREREGWGCRRRNRGEYLPQLGAEWGSCRRF